MIQLSRYEDEERLKKLGNIWAFSNTEKMTFGCNRLWVYDYFQGYVDSDKAPALRYGIVWHRILECILLEIKRLDRMVSADECRSIYKDNIQWIIEEEEPPGEYGYSDNMIDIMDRAERCLEGWRQEWEQLMLQWNIVEIEKILVMPVYDRDGNLFAPPIPILEEDNTYRPLKVGEWVEDANIKIVTWPWYKVGKIDVLLQHKTSGELMIVDHKTTAQVGAYESKMSFDMQLPSYVSQLEWEKTHGELQQYKDNNIFGVMWDLATSKIPKYPKPLKSGKLSTAKSSPSWVFEESIKTYNLAIEDYQLHIEKLKLSDANYIKHCFMRASKEVVERIKWEDLAFVERVSKMRNELPQICTSDINELSVVAPRYPICNQYGRCKFSNLCVTNIALSVIIKESSEKLFWTKDNKDT